MFVVQEKQRSLTISDVGKWIYVNGDTEYTFSYQDIEFLSHAMERHKWANGIDDAIEDQMDFLNFNTVNKEQFVDMCLDEIESLWELRDCIEWADPDYFDIVYGVAKMNEMWREI